MATRTNTFLKTIALVSFLILGSTINAQEQKEVKGQTYTIVDNGGATNIQPYIDALNNSDMRNYRLRNKRHIIAFEKGVKVELFSASEISKSGIPLNLSEYPEIFEVSRQEPVFSLAANNFIVANYISGAKH